MDNEKIRAICMAMPHVAETVNWGHHLVYWVGDRDVGGKMFASTDLDGSGLACWRSTAEPSGFMSCLRSREFALRRIQPNTSG